MPGAQVYDGGAWQTCSKLEVYDGGAWRELTGGWVYDGAAWQKFWPACQTGDLTSCGVGKNQDGYCNGSICTSYIQFNITWTYSVCQDACHHMEVWHQTDADSNCDGAWMSKKFDDLACDADPVTDTSLLDAIDAGGSSTYYCYQVRICRDSDNGTEDSVWNEAGPYVTIYCPIECGNGP